MSIFHKILGVGVATVGTATGIVVGAVGCVTGIAAEAIKKNGGKVDPSADSLSDKAFNCANDTIKNSWEMAKNFWK